MIFPASTAVFAAIFALLYLALTLWVVAGRVGKDIMHGDGGDGSFQRHIRAHANFAEYVPFALLLIALFEASGGSILLTRALLVVLLLARLAHPVGMLAPKNTPRQYAFRGGGFMATSAIIFVTAVGLLVRSL